MVNVRYCRVSNCESSSKNKDETIRFHQIPKTSFFEWVRRLKLEDVNSSNEILHVCSKHFKPNDYTNRGIFKILKSGVVPSIRISNYNTNPSLNSTNDHECQSYILRPQKTIESRITPNIPTQKLLISDPIEPTQSSTFDTVPSRNVLEQATIVYNTKDTAITVKQIINNTNPQKMKILVSCGTAEYTMTPESMSKICRICFRTEDLSCMFTTTYKNVTMNDIVGKLTHRHIPHGRLAWNLCLKCIKSLGQLHKFSERAKVSENFIHLCHEIFFDPDTLKLTETLPLIVTPALFGQGDIDNSYSNNGKPRSIIEPNQLTSKAINSSIINSRPDNKRSIFECVVDEDYKTGKEGIYKEHLEKWTNINKETGIHADKKSKLDYSKDNDMSQPISKSFTFVETTEKSILINKTNAIRTTDEILGQNSLPLCVTLTKQSDTNEEIILDYKVDKTIGNNQPINQITNIEVSATTSTKSTRTIECIQPECTKTFRTAIERRRHYLHRHVTSFCDICDSDFMGQRRLKIHFYRAHLLSTSYKCSLCESVFGKDVTYIEHKKKCKTLLH